MNPDGSGPGRDEDDDSGWDDGDDSEWGGSDEPSWNDGDDSEWGDDHGSGSAGNDGAEWDGNDGGSTARSPTDRDDGMLEFSIGFPARNGLKTVLIGAVALLFFWLIVPAIVATGYFVRLTKAAGRGDSNPPEFSDWGGLFVDGLGLVLVFVPIVLVFVLLLAVSMELHAALFFVVFLAGLYVLPAIYVSYSVHDSWAAAFDTSTLRALVTSKQYAIGVLLYVLVLNGIGSIVAMILIALSLLTIVGWIVIWPMIYFYWYAMDAALWGRVYERVETADSAGRPANR